MTFADTPNLRAKMREAKGSKLRTDVKNETEGLMSMLKGKRVHVFQMR